MFFDDPLSVSFDSKTDGEMDSIRISLTKPGLFFDS